jgi:hypothetical protein
MEEPNEQLVQKHEDQKRSRWLKIISNTSPKTLIIGWIIIILLFFTITIMQPVEYTTVIENNQPVQQPTSEKFPIENIYILLAVGIGAIMFMAKNSEPNEIMSEETAKAIMFQVIKKRQRTGTGSEEMPPGQVDVDAQAKLVMYQSRTDDGKFVQIPLFWKLGFTLRGTDYIKKRYSVKLSVKDGTYGKITEIKTTDTHSLEDAEDITISQKDHYKDFLKRRKRLEMSKVDKQYEEMDL